MKAYMNWSSGKEAALAFYRAQQSGLYDIASLFTVVHAQSQNVPMHETPLTLIRRQAQG
jgi:diphthamide synthase (EF-2-diphthine--ammonia ligase)